MHVPGRSSPGIVNCRCDRIAAQVDMRSAICFEAFTRSFEELPDLIELREVLCEDQMVHPTLIFDFS